MSDFLLPLSLSRLSARTVPIRMIGCQFQYPLTPSHCQDGLQKSSIPWLWLLNPRPSSPALKILDLQGSSSLRTSQAPRLSIQFALLPWQPPRQLLLPEFKPLKRHSPFIPAPRTHRRSPVKAMQRRDPICRPRPLRSATLLVRRGCTHHP
jgi:hypothetical protein